MRNYDRINALPPEGIERKRAHIIGGGIAGLSAAAFLVTDAHMPADRVTVYESLPVVGGSMDAAGERQTGYTSRGERELEAWMECLWYLCAKVPSLQTPGLTILDETVRANREEPIYSHFRLTANQGQRCEIPRQQMSHHDARQFMKLLATPEEELEGLTIENWFSAEFPSSVFWHSWSSMLAFQSYHSLIEAKRYLARFVHLSGDPIHLVGILHTQYNEYDSIIKPVKIWLEDLGVRFLTGTTVRDIEVSTGTAIVAEKLRIEDATGSRDIELTPDDLVFFTNGSMTQNASMGDTHTVAPLNRDTADRGCFTVWEKLAARDPRFGNPAAFLSDVDKSAFVSFFTTITDDPTFFDYLRAKTGDEAGTGGAVTIVDSSWKISFALYSKYFPDQPENVQVFWAYGQNSDVPGDYVKKPMRDCTGGEMLAELLYHCGLQDQIASILEHAYVSTAVMPYVTSQFMPRRIADRPKVIPDGSVNLAFIGQYAELPGDVVFTVETSVRTAMMAVWGLTGLDKPMIPMYEPVYDVRALVAAAKGLLGVDSIGLLDVPALLTTAPNPLRLGKVLNRLPQLQI